MLRSEVHPYIRYAVIRNICYECFTGKHSSSYGLCIRHSPSGASVVLLEPYVLGSPPVLSLRGASLGNSSAIFVTSASLGSTRPPTDCAFGIHRQERSGLYLSHTSELTKESIALADTDCPCLIGDCAWEHCHVRPLLGLRRSHIKLRLTITQCYYGNFMLTDKSTC